MENNGDYDFTGSTWPSSVACWPGCLAGCSASGAVAAVVGIGMYTLLVGTSDSVEHAAIMAGVGVFAAQVGCHQDGLNT